MQALDGPDRRSPGVERRRHGEERQPRTATKRSRQLDREQRYTIEEAAGLVKQACTAKFDETVDIAVRLGVNPKHADQMVRGAIMLPHGTGKTVRVLVFAKGDKEKEAHGRGRRLRRLRTSWWRR